MELKKKIQINSVLITVCICLITNFICLYFVAHKEGASNIQTQTINIEGSKEDKININVASIESLESLPNIGRVKATDIINNRPYQTVWDLKKIKGFGTETIKQLEGKVVCE